MWRALLVVECEADVRSAVQKDVVDLDATLEFWMTR